MTDQSPAPPSLREAINVMHRAGFAGTSWTLGPEEVAHVLALAASPAPSPSTTVPASSELEIVGYVPEHQIPAGFQFACLSCRVILGNEVALVRLPDAQAQIDALTLERNRWIAACHESVREARDWRAQYHAIKAITPSSEAARLADEAKALSRKFAYEQHTASNAHDGLLSAITLGQFEAAIDRLASLSASQAPAAQWRSIETAPVAKNLLLLWRPVDHAERVRYVPSIVIGSLEYDPVTYLSNGIVWANGMTYDISTHITHWMPLPAAPDAATQQPRGEPADNSRCKFASGGARCVSHCGDSDCAAMASTKG